MLISINALVLQFFAFQRGVNVEMVHILHILYFSRSCSCLIQNSKRGSLMGKMHLFILLCVLWQYARELLGDWFQIKRSPLVSKAMMAEQSKIIEWKTAAWFKSKFPLKPGKGIYNPPHRLLENLPSDAERTAEVLKWRDLSTREQLAEKERLGYKVRNTSKPTSEAAEEVVQEQETTVGEEEAQEPSPIVVGLMDSFEARQAYAEKMESELKKKLFGTLEPIQNQ
jgi:hypothetical protein